MVIDDSGEWWTGSEPSDIKTYLAEYTAGANSYPATAFLAVTCSCQSDRFRISRARSSTQRTCVDCGQVAYISRSGDSSGWDEAIDYEEIPDPYACAACSGDQVNVCVGFAGYANHPGSRGKKKSASSVPDAVLWFYVGVRCIECGTLGCFNDGKVGRGQMDESFFREITGESSNG